MNRFRSLVAASLVASITGLGVPLPAQAAMIGTGDAVQSAARARLNSLLERRDLQAKLESYGVKVADVKARVAALSDDEAAQLASQAASAGRASRQWRA